MLQLLVKVLSLSGLRKDWPLFSEDEVRVHNSRRSLWIVSGNSVYDVTAVLTTHPGGEAAILRRGGGAKDCNADYAFHSFYARREWDARKVGEVTPEAAAKLFPSRQGELSTEGRAQEFHQGSASTVAAISHTRVAFHEESHTRTVDTYASTTVTPDQAYRRAEYELCLQQVH
ncbi:hypothetical protein ABB37_04658 [Leptomonas pyrrhocoris]|uniref:Cytochrome b5 heme-binding domain-containing protein n=1 Tax=Leptomonas pyrrhocoris TaxID=157538 RepID=A0A0N1J4U1_LEPPY|nr:hypothetical protein ABB37_04658 [Leptomonas pyrrhocoris]KPA80421.1 hypothetical protein ABB37_04658 [Leptomonas pyrrhocoris]|eukprot:XP_015658860.1 hypothetical protein ABB37_04658 [Leptomonas pyrrhocoris]